MRIQLFAVCLVSFLGLRAVCQADPESDLRAAALLGDADAVRAQIQLGADVNAADHRGQTALYEAVSSLSIETVQVLLDHGADSDAANVDGRPPLLGTMSTNRESIEICRLLLESGADVNKPNIRGYTLLMVSAEAGLVDFADLFLEHGATLPTDEDESWRLLSLSATGGVPRIFDLMTDRIGELEPRKVKALMGASAHGSSGGIVRRVIALGGDPTEIGYFGFAPIHTAAGFGHMGVVAALVEGGAEIDARDGRGRTAYNISQSMNHPAVSEYLRTAGADTSGPQLPPLEGPYIGQTPPGDDPTVFARGIASVIGGGDAQHSTPVFSPSGDEVYWSDTVSGPIMGMRIEGGRWTAPEPVEFMTEFGEDAPMFSLDGSKLFFLSQRPLGRDTLGGNEHIWFVRRHGQGWGDPEPVSEAVTSYKTHWQFSIGPNDDLYFQSESGAGPGGHDIYMSRFVDGEYAEPERLGSEVNTELDEWSPFVSPDGRYMLFSRTGSADDVMNWDLFISIRRADGTWGEAENLGESVNSPSGELCPIVTPDGKYLLFIRRGTFWWASAEETIGRRLAQAGQ